MVILLEQEIVSGTVYVRLDDGFEEDDGGNFGYVDPTFEVTIWCFCWSGIKPET